jgi:hypothetical protein
MFHFTPEMEFAEAKNRERQKIGIERRYIAANGDAFLERRTAAVRVTAVRPKG